MLEIKRDKNGHGYDIFNIVTDEGKFQISYENNLDLYWSYSYHGNIDECQDTKTFIITKENYYLYKALDELYMAISYNMPYYNYPYATEGREEMRAFYGSVPLYDGAEIKWYSDDFAIIDNASSFIIRKKAEYFMIIFNKSKTEDFNGCYFPTYSVRIRTSGSRYGHYYIPFISMYQNLKTYNPKYHQIHIDEYLYEENYKKRLKTK